MERWRGLRGKVELGGMMRRKTGSKDGESMMRGSKEEEKVREEMVKGVKIGRQRKRWESRKLKLVPLSIGSSLFHMLFNLCEANLAQASTAV